MRRPFTFINLAMTADGKIDTFERRGAAISSPQDKQRVDRLRAEADAVMVGGRTILQEDPSLTIKSDDLRSARVARGLPANPMKVGILTRAELPLRCRFLTAGRGRVVIFATFQSSEDQLYLLRSREVEVVLLGDQQVDLIKALEHLHQMGVHRLMVEGGATLNFELLRLGLVDELIFYVAPLIFGGASAPTPASGAGLERNRAIRLELLDVERWEDGGLLLHYKPEARG